ncbi:MAG: iron-sulfur cluster assembly accessory protein [candidate division KSB1 bacterium]|nr:iron-sulfur cluster assembly accessory protein [candidate division KSB1 bacterium]MDQ7064312.1 iron-sulfur cluster assembly accessory protein [candidate division KSB1 bacterium]
MITLTVTAIDRILTLMEKEDEKDLALRIAITGRGPGGFQYNLKFVKVSEKTDNDEVVDIGPFQIIMDRDSARKLNGATMDYIEDGYRGGFEIENPNSVWDDPVAQRVQQVIDHQINPQIASHGGVITLMDVKNGTAFIAFGGGCQGCGMVDVTLKQGVETMIKRAVPEIKHVVDITDHAAGTNPYYKPSSGGASPFGG